MSEVDDVLPSGQVEQTISEETADAVIEYKEPIGVSLEAEEALGKLLHILDDCRSEEVDDKEVAEALAEASVQISLVKHMHDAEAFSSYREQRVEKLEQRYGDSNTNDAVTDGGEKLYDIYLDAIHDVAERWGISTEEAERWLENHRVFRAIRGDCCV